MIRCPNCGCYNDLYNELDVPLIISFDVNGEMIEADIVEQVRRYVKKYSSETMQCGYCDYRFESIKGEIGCPVCGDHRVKAKGNKAECQTCGCSVTTDNRENPIKDLFDAWDSMCEYKE